MKTTPSTPWIALLLLSAFVLSSVQPSRAATFVVNSILDSGDTNAGDGVCSSFLGAGICTVRAAVLEANALPGHDRIEVPNLTVDLTLVGNDDSGLAGDLDITDPVEITGLPGSRINGLNGDRIFHVLPGVRASISAFALQNGPSGILNQGTLNLEDVEIVDMTGDGVRNEGTLLARRIYWGFNDGTHLVSPGTAVVDRSEFEGHSLVLVGPWSVDYKGGRVQITNSVIETTGPVVPFVNAGSQFGYLTSGGTPGNQSLSIRGSSIEAVTNGGPDCPVTDADAEITGSTVVGGGCDACNTAGVSTGYNWFEACANALPTDVVGLGGNAYDLVPADRCTLLGRRSRSRDVSDGFCDAASEDLGANYACRNGLDDDGDGFVDLQDPGCRDALDPLEGHIRPGDLVIANFDTGGVTAFDPVTTRLFPITRATAISPYDILADDDGAIHVSDSTLASLTAVDVEQGGAHLVSAGDQLQSPTGIDQNWLGEWFVGDRVSDAIFEIDPQTGVQSLITSHPDFGDIDDILRRPGTGSLYVSDTGSGVRLVDDPLGSPSVYTIATTTVTVPRQLDFDSAFDLVIADSGDNIPAWKDLQSISETPLLTAPGFTNMQGAAVEPSGLSLFTDYDTGKIKRVDESADTATTLNFGREEPGINHLDEVPAAASLTLELTDLLLVDGGTVGVADIGDTLELTAVVTNVGSGTATSLSLESGLDPNLTLVAGQLTTTQGTIVEGSLASDPRLEVDLGSLAPAATATVTWKVDVADPAPARFVTANAWVRRDKVILAESDDPDTGPIGDRTVVGVGDYGIVVGASQKISDIRGGLSGVGNPGALLADASKFGRGPADLGDFDGDGRKEIVVGAHKANAGAGAVYLLDIAPDGAVVETKEVGPVTGLLPGEEFGYKVESLGDLDGAGPSAVAIAVTSWRPLTFAVHILFLDAQGDVIPGTQKLIGHGTPAGLTVSNISAFGFALANLGDLDGAGPAAAALAVGAPFTGASDGYVYVFFLDSAGNVLSSPAFQKIGYASGGMTVDPGFGARFGHGLAFLGNIDAGAAPEIAVGAPNDASLRGAVWVLSLNPDGTVFGEWKIDHNDPALTGQLENDDELGIALTSLDLDGDGIPEVVATARGDDDGAQNAGAAYVLWLDPILQSAAKVRKISATSGAFFGVLEESDYLQEVGMIGDLDGDGLSELAVGVPFDDDAGSDRGGLHILYPATPVPEPGFLLGLGSGILMLNFLDRRRRRR